MNPLTRLLHQEPPARTSVRDADLTFVTDLLTELIKIAEAHADDATLYLTNVRYRYAAALSMLEQAKKGIR